MSQPTRYARGYSFTGYQASTPHLPLPGSRLDGELENIEASLNSAISGINDIRRADGALKNGIVTKDALAPGLSTGVDPATLWESGIAYSANNVVFFDAAFYRCLQSHTSTSTFSVDLAAGNWEVFADFSAYFTNVEAWKDQAEAAASSADSDAATAASAKDTAVSAAATAASAKDTAVSAAATASSASSNATSLYDLFDDRYLGEKTSLPTLDNDGNALVNGALVSLTGQADVTLNGMYVRRSGLWQAMFAPTAVWNNMQTFTATGGQTVFTVTGGYIAGYALVFLNGAKLVNGVDVDVSSGSTVTLTTGASAGDILDVQGFRVFDVGVMDGANLLNGTVLPGKLSFPAANTADTNTFSALNTFSAGAQITPRYSVGADMNALFGDGEYLLENPSNGPPVILSLAPSLIYVQVTKSPISALWAVQTAHGLGYGGFRTGVWRRKFLGGSWGAWAPLSGVASPEHFGAMGDGAVDDSAPLEAALRSGFPVELRGAYRITRKVFASRTTHGFNTLCVRGVGRSAKIILDSPTAMIEIDVGDVVEGNTLQAVFRDFSIVPNANNTTTAALYISASDSVGSGVVESTLRMENVHVRPSSFSNGTLWGFGFRNMRLSTITNCSAVGKRNSLTSGGHGFYFSGHNSVIPVETTFDGCRAYYFEFGFELAGAWEGVKILNGDVIAASVGYKATSTNANLGDSLVIENCQANVLYVGIWLEDIKNSRINQNQLTGNAAWGTPTAFYGIFSRANQAQGQFTAYRDNIINGEQIKAAVGAGACMGLSIDGYSSGSLGSDVGPNFYTTLKTGLQIGANVRNTVFDNSSSYFTCDTNVQNLTTGTPNRLRAATTAF